MNRAELRSREGPVWLRKFVRCNYFEPCQEHRFKKNEKRHFCIDCIEGPLCSRGLQSHPGHRTLQVRKASRADGVRVENVYKLLDISGIQTYIINDHKIVYLLRQAKGNMIAKGGATRHCQTCSRVLSDPVRFCCIKCKIVAVQRGIGGSSLSLSPESRPSAPGTNGLHFQNHEELGSPKYAQVRDFEDTILRSSVMTKSMEGNPREIGLDPMVHGLSQLERQAIQALEERQRKRKIEVPIKASDYVRIEAQDPLLSPISVLQDMGPMGCALDDAVSSAATTSQLHYNPQRSLVPDFEDNHQQGMQLEVALIRRKSRKSRKSSPHRAPMW